MDRVADHGITGLSGERCHCIFLSLFLFSLFLSPFSFSPLLLRVLLFLNWFNGWQALVFIAESRRHFRWWCHRFKRRACSLFPVFMGRSWGLGGLRFGRVLKDLDMVGIQNVIISLPPLGWCHDPTPTPVTLYAKIPAAVHVGLPWRTTVNQSK